MVLINITEEMMSEAKKMAVDMVNNGLYNRFGGDFDYQVEKAKIGCIGEIAFEKYLADSNIPFATDRTGHGERHADDFDVKINNKKIDIKTAKTERTPIPKWTYGYPKQQMGMSKNYIVICYYSPSRNTVGIYGWMEFSRLTEFPVTYKNNFANFSYKTPNHEFPISELNTDIGLLINEVTR